MFIAVSNKAQAEIVESLAKEIWTEHYTTIVSEKQIDYMLAKFQSKQAILKQIRTGFLYFLIEKNEQFIGYISVQPNGDELFLSKIYIKSSKRHQGHGKKAIQFLEGLAKSKGLKRIALTVNKNNINTIKAYEKIGFKNLGPVTQDIGDGFIMDDFKMEKIVYHSDQPEQKLI